LWRKSCECEGWPARAAHSLHTQGRIDIVRQASAVEDELVASSFPHLLEGVDVSLCAGRVHGRFQPAENPPSARVLAADRIPASLAQPHRGFSRSCPQRLPPSLGPVIGLNISPFHSVDIPVAALTPAKRECANVRQALSTRAAGSPRCPCPPGLARSVPCESLLPGCQSCCFSVVGHVRSFHGQVVVTESLDLYAYGVTGENTLLSVTSLSNKRLSLSSVSPSRNKVSTNK